ncbi:uncharacterized protein FIESC28_02331 [Fusarium coffeatum]|uniref:Uncharacterized protein n=1 Tax=Fusarium coffeatum TaxID=231269 RepID=A0A366S6G1_9HYPO|nr:uncharacterized protein FIESC28_02331 [Fusarium coffeatum]RBR24913.1 hypothetical protein FIESC28_02331 [Fusarium coffeatum]
MSLDKSIHSSQRDLSLDPDIQGYIRPTTSNLVSKESGTVNERQALNHTRSGIIVQQIDSNDDSNTRVNNASIFNRKGALFCICLSWAFEFTLLLIAVAVFAGILVILKQYNNKEVPDWENLGITLNTLISILATALRAIISLIAYELLAQTKWDWISVTFRPLPQLQLFENASRGVYGSLRLLPIVARRQPVALGAAVLAILSLGIGSFTQQSVQTYQRRVSVPAGRGSATVTISRTANDYSLLNLNPVLMDYGERHFVGLNVKTRTAIHDSLVNIYNDSNIGSLFTCSSGNCTFPTFANSPSDQDQDKITYASLGMCSRCVDVHDFVEGPEFAAEEEKSMFTTVDEDDYNFTTYTLPVYRFSKDKIPMRLEFGHAYLSDDVYMTVRRIGNVTWTRRVASPEFINAARWSVANFSVLTTPQEPCTQYQLSCPWGYGLPTQYVAAACTLFPCLKYYTAAVVNSRLREKVVREVPLRPQKSGSLWYGPVVTDSPSGSGKMGFTWNAVQYPCHSEGILYTSNNMSSGPGDVLIHTENWANQSIDEPAQYINIKPPYSCLFNISGPLMSAFEAEFNSTFNAKCFKTELSFLECRHNDSLTYTDFLRGFSRGISTSFDTIKENVESLAMRLTSEMRQRERSEYAEFFKDIQGVAWENQVSIRIVWVWLVFPGALLVLCGILLLWVMARDIVLGRVSIWKSSILPLVLKDYPGTGTMGLQELEEVSETLEVKLERRNPEI